MLRIDRVFVRETHCRRCSAKPRGAVSTVCVGVRTLDSSRDRKGVQWSGEIQLVAIEMSQVQDTSGWTGSTRNPGGRKNHGDVEHFSDDPVHDASH